MYLLRRIAYDAGRIAVRRVLHHTGSAQGDYAAWMREAAAAWPGAPNTGASLDSIMASLRQSGGQHAIDSFSRLWRREYDRKRTPDEAAASVWRAIWTR